MHRSTYELMREQVRAIHRALTGSDLPEGDGHTPSGLPASTPEIVARRFTDLEAIARTLSVVAERVPPFAFSPPIDVIDEENELLIEAAIPGVDKSDVTVDLSGDVLVIAGVRVGERASNGRAFRHAEIPRGPFRRVVLLPYPVMGEPRAEVERGMIRIHLAKLPKSSAAKA